MTTSIFCKSCSKDFQWLKYCLKSIGKFCSGFHEVVIVVPIQDLPEILSWNLTKEKVIGIDESQWTDLYLHQQVVKLHADLYCDTKSEYVLFVDSDCCFTRECTPQSFFVGSLPYMMKTSFASIGNQVDIWKKTTEKALKCECEFETMRRIPIMYPIHVLSEFRQHMISLHGKTVEEYIKEQPRGEFSEFNALGNYCLKFHSEKFFWWDTVKEPNLPQKVANQEWSWGGITGQMKSSLERITE